MKVSDMTDSQLIAKEEKLRDMLAGMANSGQLYAKRWYQWFALREVGLSRGVFDTFVPLPEQKRRAL